MRDRLVLLIVSVLLIGAVHGVQGSEVPTLVCENQNDSSFLNACRKERESGFWTIIANFVAEWFNPRAQALVSLFLVLFLYLRQTRYASPKPSDPSVLGQLTTPSSSSSGSLINTHNASIPIAIALHYMHMLTFSLCLDVALYAVFRQHRPCICNGAKIGSIYGMPSGDALAGGLLAAYLVDANVIGGFVRDLVGSSGAAAGWISRRILPGTRVWSVVAAVLLVFFVCEERVALGFHTIGQVTVGTCLAIVLYIYSTRAPLWCVYVDAVIQTILGSITLHVDPALKYGYDDMNNLWAWFVWGLAFEVLVCIMLYRERAHIDWRWSTKRLQLFADGVHANTVAESEEHTGLLERRHAVQDNKPQQPEQRASPFVSKERGAERDLRWLFCAMIVFAFVSIMSNFIQRYGWMSHVESH